MADLFNWTTMLGTIIGQGSTYTTGSVEATMLIIFIALLIVAMLLFIPLEWALLIILPLALAGAAYYSGLIGVLLVIFILLAVVMVKLWFLR